MIAAIAVVLFGFAVALLNPIVLIVYIGISVLLVLAVSLVVGGFVNSFASSSITLTYKELVK